MLVFIFICFQAMLQQSTTTTSTTTRNIAGFWTKNDGSNMRKFLEKFATDRSIDISDPKQWYKVKRQDIVDAGVSNFLLLSGKLLYS